MLTRSIKAAMRSGSGMVPGALISSIKLNLESPACTTLEGTKCRSLKNTVSESLVIPGKNCIKMNAER